MSTEESRDFETGLRHWAMDTYGPEAAIFDVERMPGHSGISYSFRLERDGVREELVMRVPPLGVRQSNNLDVVRFAPVLDLAYQSGIPVPEVRSWSREEHWFGTPFLMVSRVNGSPLPDVFEPGHDYPETATVNAIFRESMRTLAAIHSMDPTSLLETGWATPATREDDLAMWLPLVRKSDNETEVAHAEELGRKLQSRRPADVSPKVVHGDFYSNNWMIHDGSIQAVLDWENATLNDPGWDLGWISTIYDPRCWGPTRSPLMTWHPEPEQLYSWYESATEQPIRSANWYQALMCYRLACITPAKVRLHRSGRRVDPVWETFAEAIPYLLDRGFELIEQER